MQHHEKPEPSELPPEVAETITAWISSPYGKYLEQLRTQIKGKIVARTEAGNAGYLLQFTDESWVLCYLEDGTKLEWQTGTGEPDSAALQKLHSDFVGDGFAPHGADLPYANETNDKAAEVASSIGKAVTGLAIGSDTFNICFPEGMELDANLYPAQDGKPALRVFWEQW